MYRMDFILNFGIEVRNLRFLKENVIDRIVIDVVWLMRYGYYFDKLLLLILMDYYV